MPIMVRIFFLGLVFSIVNGVISQFPLSKILQGNFTPTYAEMMHFYDSIVAVHSDVQMFTVGYSDYGLPIHLVVLNAAADSVRTFEKAKTHPVLMINNGIHPGEPCGIDASMQLVLDYVQIAEKTQRAAFPVVGIIPSYNLGGMMNRSSFSRANQDGPEEYGFRGNAKNLDLNRDFIKMDSRNMAAFAKAFHALDPDMLIDTHTTNGADYPYTMTYISPLYDRLTPPMQQIVYDEILPFLAHSMVSKWGYDIFPYVVMVGKTPEKGIKAFNASGMYAQGYGELFHTVTFTTEAHMLKPFEERVKSTYYFCVDAIAWLMSNGQNLKNTRAESRRLASQKNTFQFDYQAREMHDSIYFNGYKALEEPSKITTQPRLRYDRDQPFSQYIPYFFQYDAKKSVKVPKYYLVEGQESAVISRLRQNGVELLIIEKDTVVEAESLIVASFESSKTPYEGRFIHSNINVERELLQRSFKKGDVIIPMNDPKTFDFLLNVLEPEVSSSYFWWGFFDSYMMQKEYFSPYIFEEIALAMLENDKALEKEFREKQAADEDFANNRWEQLYFLYKRSPYFEPSYRRLPIYKIY
jgi:hypothetical protein